MRFEMPLCYGKRWRTRPCRFTIFTNPRRLSSRVAARIRGNAQTSTSAISSAVIPLVGRRTKHRAPNSTIAICSPGYPPHCFGGGARGRLRAGLCSSRSLRRRTCPTRVVIFRRCPDTEIGIGVDPRKAQHGSRFFADGSAAAGTAWPSSSRLGIARRPWPTSLETWYRCRQSNARV